MLFRSNAESLAPYDGIMFPSLQARWNKQPPRGEVVGVSAALDGDLVGFVIGERLLDGTAEIISLFVEPSYRRQGIATRLVSILENDSWDAGIRGIRVFYTPSRWTTAALEPLLKKRGWQITSLDKEKTATKSHPLILNRGSEGGVEPSLKIQLRTLFETAKQRVAAQDYAGAIACYQEALQIFPEYAPTYCNLASIWQLQGKLPEAIQALQQEIGRAHV